MALKVDWGDWSLGPGRHPIQGALHAGAIAFGVTAVGDAVDMPAGWPLVAGLGLGLAASAHASWRQMVRDVVAYRAACCVGAGVWSSIILAWSSPWTWQAPACLAALTVGAGAYGVALARLDGWRPSADRAKAKVKDEPETPAVKGPLAAEWQTRLRRVTRRQVVVAKVDWWEPATGYTLSVLLPADGTTLADIKSYESQLATAANLPAGCNVEVLPVDGGRRLIRIRVAVESAMAEVRHFDQDTSPLSIADPLWIGDYADRAPATINLRYACGVLVGQTDSGKSNTLNGITHQLVRCTDAIVWAIDLSGSGRFPRPWVRAWYEGRAPAPAIDWAAVTAEQALSMTEAAINIINGRTAAYQDLMYRANEDKLPVSPEIPEIVILVDEFADLPEPVKNRLETISNTGRGAGVRLVSSVLRAIGADIPRSMIVQARERIGMRVTDEAELQYLFDSVWSRGRFDPASMTHQGSGMLSTGASAPAPFKARRLEPRRIDAASVAVATLRPVLDEVSAHLAETVTFEVKDKYGNRQTEVVTGVYSTRWERALPLMFPAAVRTTEPPPRVAAAAGGGTTTIAPPRQEESKVDDDSGRELDEASRRLQEAVAKKKAEQEAAAGQEPGTGPEPEIDADFTVVEGWLSGAPDAGQPRPKPQVRVRQIVQANRRDGIGPRAVHQQLRDEAYPTAEQTVIGWMRADAAAGILAQPGGDRAPYVPGPKFTEEL